MNPLDLNISADPLHAHMAQCRIVSEKAFKLLKNLSGNTKIKKKAIIAVNQFFTGNYEIPENKIYLGPTAIRFSLVVDKFLMIVVRDPNHDELIFIGLLADFCPESPEPPEGFQMGQPQSAQHKTVAAR